MHIVDLYATLLGRAGIDPYDGDTPSPIDSLDMWNWWIGATPESPRTTMVTDHNMFNVSGNGVTGGRTPQQELHTSHIERSKQYPPVPCSIKARKV